MTPLPFLIPRSITSYDVPSLVLLPVYIPIWGIRMPPAPMGPKVFPLWRIIRAPGLAENFGGVGRQIGPFKVSWPVTTSGLMKRKVGTIRRMVIAFRFLMCSHPLTSNYLSKRLPCHFSIFEILYLSLNTKLFWFIIFVCKQTRGYRQRKAL